METEKKVSRSSAVGNKKSWGRFIGRLLVILVLLGSIGAATYFYMNYKKLKENPQIIAQNEVKMVTDAVGKLMELPQGEDANLATVLDKEKLKEQDFFKRAENGDKILIYVKAKKAILYRPSIKKIIEVAPLFLGENQAQNQPANTANTTNTTNTTDTTNTEQ